MEKGQKIMTGFYCFIQASAYISLLYVIGDFLAKTTNAFLYSWGMFGFVIVMIVAIIQAVLLGLFVYKPTIL